MRACALFNTVRTGSIFGRPLPNLPLGGGERIDVEIDSWHGPDLAHKPHRTQLLLVSHIIVILVVIIIIIMIMINNLTAPNS